MKKIFLLGVAITVSAIAVPILQMNQAFLALSGLVPFLTEEKKFVDKANEKIVVTKMEDLQKAFKNLKHDQLLKQDLFSPSYNLINQNITSSLEAFKKGQKDISYWELKEVTSLCIDCHTRLPEVHASSFQNGEFQIPKDQFDSPYNLGIAQLIVRRYSDAKQSFVAAIDQNILRKNYGELLDPLKQIVLIESKIKRDPKNLIIELDHYIQRDKIPEPLKTRMKGWKTKAQSWKDSKDLAPLTSDGAVERFIKKHLAPLKKEEILEDGNEIDLLISSGLLSNYFFEHPESKKAPEINYWLGWSEKYLKRDNFFGSGDLFLKQCVLRYPKSPIAKNCYAEYEESVRFEFTGSRGTDIPKDVELELKRLKDKL